MVGQSGRLTSVNCDGYTWIERQGGCFLRLEVRVGEDPVMSDGRYAGCEIRWKEWRIQDTVLMRRDVAFEIVAKEMPSRVDGP